MWLLTGAPSVRYTIVYAALVQRMDCRSLEMSRSQTELAAIAHCTDRHVKRCLAFLVANEVLIHVAHGNQHQRSVYRLGPAVLGKLDGARDISVSPARMNARDIQMSQKKSGA